MRRCTFGEWTRPADAQDVSGLLGWHPTEVSGLVAGVALGLRGRVQLRGDGLTVSLTDESAQVWVMELSAVLASNQAAQRVRDTNSLTEAEVSLGGVTVSELDHERSKASRMQPPTDALPDDLLSRAARYAKSP